MNNINDFLIERLQNFTLDRKVLSVNTNDRDITKFPNPSEFEIICPQIYSNVESVRLLNIQLPDKFYNISNHLQNNKLRVNISDNTNTVTIDDGLYTVEQLQNALEKKLKDINTNFVVKYNSINCKMYFGNTIDAFYFDFRENNEDFLSCSNNIYTQSLNWGLGALLGFSKIKYHSSVSSDLDLSWIDENSNILIPPNLVDINVNNIIYMEIDKLNTIDEIKPSLNKFNNLNCGVINSFFAKIPLLYTADLNFSNDTFSNGLSYYQPPIDKITKLKFKFRYHNGILVDLYNYNISFTLEINQIRNELKNYNVRKPFIIS